MVFSFYFHSVDLTSPPSKFFESVSRTAIHRGRCEPSTSEWITPIKLFLRIPDTRVAAELRFSIWNTYVSTQLGSVAKPDVLGGASDKQLRS